MEIDFILRLQETADRSIRNEGRIKKLEEANETLQKLATSVALMAQQMQALNDSVGTLSDKVGKIENKPAKRWDGLVDKVICLLVGAVMAYLLGQIGL